MTDLGLTIHPDDHAQLRNAMAQEIATLRFTVTVCERRIRELMQESAALRAELAKHTSAPEPEPEAAPVRLARRGKR